MSQWKFDHFSNLCKSVSASTNVIISYSVCFLFILSLNWLSFVMNHRIRSNYNVLSWISFDHFKLNRFKSSSYNESVPLSYWSVSVLKVRNKVCLCDISINSFNGVTERQDMDSVSIRYIMSCMNGNNISKSHPKILSNRLVHPDVPVF